MKPKCSFKAVVLGCDEGPSNSVAMKPKCSFKGTRNLWGGMAGTSPSTTLPMKTRRCCFLGSCREGVFSLLSMSLTQPGSLERQS
ncbi:hypothetical protein ACOMHN_031504 [Nucella lapillus]